jgi:hypothetical protein
MNTPRQKKRFQRLGPGSEKPQGSYVAGLNNDAFASVFARILSEFEHLETVMPIVLEHLAQMAETRASGYIYRTLRNPSIRSDIMRKLLETAPFNKDTDERFDEILSEYDEVRRLRNQYAHGLWWTGEDGQTVCLSASDPHGYSFLEARPIETSELEETLAKVRALTKKVVLLDILPKKLPPKPPRRLP